MSADACFLRLQDGGGGKVTPENCLRFEQLHLIYHVGHIVTPTTKCEIRWCTASESVSGVCVRDERLTGPDVDTQLSGRQPVLIFPPRRLQLHSTAQCMCGGFIKRLDDLSSTTWPQNASTYI